MSSPPAFRELPAFREVILPRAGDSRASAVQSGPLVRVRRLLPSVHPESTLSLQLESVLDAVRSVVGELGGGLDDIARVTFFLREVKDRTALNDVWSRWFPDPENRPPHKYLPAGIPGGYLVMVDATAVLDDRRKTLKIPGVGRRDGTAGPRPLGRGGSTAGVARTRDGPGRYGDAPDGSHGRGTGRGRAADGRLSRCTTGPRWVWTRA